MHLGYSDLKPQVTEPQCVDASARAQFSVTRDRRQLATAQAGVERILQHAAQPPPKELWDSPIPIDEVRFRRVIPGRDGAAWCSMLTLSC